MFRKLLPALVAPLLLTTACAKAADDDAVRVVAASPIEALRAAPDRAADAGTARFEMQMTAGPDGAVVMSASGATDYASGRGSLSLDMGDLLGAFPGGLEGADEPIEVVLADGVVYLRVPFLAMVTGTDAWLSASPEDLGQDAGALGLGGGTTDPSQLLETLRGVADDVTDDGRETVRGVDTTRYTATVDLDRAIAEAAPSERDRLDALVEELDTDLPAVPITVWVDDEGLPRRLTMTLDLGVAAGRASISIEMFDYGEPVDVVVPSPDEVTPMSDLLGPLTSGLGDGAS